MQLLRDMVFRPTEKKNAMQNTARTMYSVFLLLAVGVVAVVMAKVCAAGAATEQSIPRCARTFGRDRTQ